MKTKLITITLVGLVAVLVSVPLPTLNQTNAQVTAGTLNVAISPNTPDEAIVAVGTSGKIHVPLIAVDFIAGWEAMKITKIEVKIAGTAPTSVYRNIQLYEGSTQLGNTIPSVPTGVSTVKFELLYDYPIIPANSKKTLRLTADLVGIGGEVSTGQTVQFDIEENKVKAIGETSGVEVTANGNVIGNQMVLRKSAPVFSTSVNSPSPSSIRVVGTQTLYQWVISVEPAGDYWETSLGWRNILFTISGSITVEGTKYTIGYIGSETSIPSTEGVWMTNGSVAKLLIPKNSIEVYDGSTLLGRSPGVSVTNSPTGSTISAVMDIIDEAIIGGGQTRPYNLRGFLEFGTTPGDIILIRVPSIAKSLITSDYATVASGDVSLVWTDRSAIDHSLTTNDWTNDYLVSGIPTEFIYDLDNDGIPDSEDPETVVSTNETLEAGEYTFKNLIITNNSILTLNSNTSFEGFKGVKINAENLTIDLGSSVSADKKGYLGGEGPGAGKGQSGFVGWGEIGYWGSGAGYGGKGGNTQYSGGNTAEGGLPYGSLYEPTDLGSGGGNAEDLQGGRGGGALIINIPNTLTVRGTISANGEGGHYFGHRRWSGGGSGGSIYITTNILTGSGLITANGGKGTLRGGGGAGGRVAIYSQKLKDFDFNNIKAYGGEGYGPEGAGGGEAGSIVIEKSIPPTLAQIIQEKEISRISVTVGEQGYYIVTISCYIDPETLKCLPDSEPTKVYVDTEGNPVFDSEVSRKIGIIDYVHQLLQRDQFKEDELEKKINDLKVMHDFVLTTDMADVYTDTIIEIFPTSVNILAELFGITGSEAAKLLLNAMDDLEEDARTDLIIAVSNFEIIKSLVYHNDSKQIITDYDAAYQILDNYLSAQFNEHMARFITDKIYTERYGEEDLDIFLNKVAQIVLKTFTIGLSEECLAKDVKWKYEIEEEKEIRKIEIQLSETFYGAASYTLKLAQNFSFDFSSTHIDINTESFTWGNLCSPGELRAYDFEGNITGLMNGEIREEIPNSIYDKENEIIIIFESSGFYYYEVAGTDTGTYKLEVATVENGEATLFTAIDIPITARQNHQYIIDWDTLSQGEKGVTLQIDADSDGTFEQTVTADNDLTYDEFILQTETIIDFDPDTLNLEDKGKFITVYIELPEGYKISQIDIPSIMLNGLVLVLVKPTEIGDYDSDVVPDLMVKFDRSKVRAILGPGEEVILTLTGEVFYSGDYVDFKGSDTIRVINHGEGKK